MFNCKNNSGFGHDYIILLTRIHSKTSLQSYNNMSWRSGTKTVSNALFPTTNYNYHAQYRVRIICVNRNNFIWIKLMDMYFPTAKEYFNNYQYLHSWPRIETNNNWFGLIRNFSKCGKNKEQRTSKQIILTLYTHRIYLCQ